MSNLAYKPVTHRRRPHIQPPNGTLFVTFRLAGSLPKSAVRKYKAKIDWLEDQLYRATNLAAEHEMTPDLEHWIARIEAHKREWFMKSEDILHRANFGPTWLKDERVADKVVENLHRLDGDAYRLDAFSVMSNHVHVVVKPFLSAQDLVEICEEARYRESVSNHPGLAKIMHSLKGRSARECNLILGRSGSFWEHESFDHVIRQGKFDKTVRYVLNNPLKVGLVRDWRIGIGTTVEMSWLSDSNPWPSGLRMLMRIERRLTKYAMNFRK